MINWINKGEWLLDELKRYGLTKVSIDKVVTILPPGNDKLAQSIIDVFDPLPYAQAEAKQLVKDVAISAYNRYATDAPGKGAVYERKALEAKQFSIDGSIGPYMQARITRTGETAATVAAIWDGLNTGWTTISANIDAIQDDANAAIDAETDWTLCDGIAQAVIAEIEAI